MKSIIYKFLLLWIIVSGHLGCIKDSCNGVACIKGEWIWIRTAGGFVGETLTPESEKIIRRLVITDTEYLEFVNNKLVLQSNYSTNLIENHNSGQDPQLLINIGSIGELGVDVDFDNLLFREPCADCYIHEYKRIR